MFQNYLLSILFLTLLESLVGGQGQPNKMLLWVTSEM